MTHKLPLYLQIRELLLRELGAGKWLRGERLPTEAELARQLEVAVGTLRKALAALEQDGILERRQGSGTYVAEGHQGQGIYHFFRLENRNGKTGTPSAQVLDLQKIQHDWAARTLHLPPHTPCWCIRRRRLLDGEVVAVEDVLLPVSRAPSLTRTGLHESLYLYYRERLGFWIARVEDAVALGKVPDWEDGALGLAAGEPCGLVERRAYDQHDTVAECSLLWFNPQRARYMARWS
ncbi:MAG: GntR family transcriptional regulator [Thiolinea sp.]